MSAAPRIVLEDRESALDLALFLRRARALDDDGARITVVPHRSVTALEARPGGRLDVCVPVLTRSGLLDQSMEIFGVRSWEIASQEPVDAVYEHAALLDRLERDGGVDWPVPPAEVHRAWAGQGIPREGWQPAGTLPTAALVEADRTGSRQIADSLPADPGQAMVHQARRAVWGSPEGSLGGLPAGVGFGAVKLGFLGDPSQAPSSVPVRQREGHVLVSLPYGSIVVRVPGLPGDR